MRLSPPVAHKYDFELWGPKVLNDANGTIVYELIEVRVGTLTSGRQQSYLYTDTQVPYGSMLRNVTDANGILVFEVMGEPYDVYVHSSEPVLNVYSQVTGYRAVLRRSTPNLTNGATHF